jgi:hypothetical protein
VRILGISALFITPALSASASQPYIEFGGISGSAGTVSITRVPIVLSSGKVIYKDVMILLQADANGILSPSIPIQAISPPLPTQTLQAGIYVDVANTSSAFEFNGPAQLANGVGKWIIYPATGFKSDCGVPASIYTGSLSANPLAARLKAAKITDTEYSYGEIASFSGNIPFCGGAFWNPNFLIGVSQVGNQVEFALFTSSGTDVSAPVARIDFVLYKKT